MTAKTFDLAKVRNLRELGFSICAARDGFTYSERGTKIFREFEDAVKEFNTADDQGRFAALMKLIEAVKSVDRYSRVAHDPDEAAIFKTISRDFRAIFEELKAKL
ncbi:MAG: hypothetical protein Q8M24_15555 [Pseudolabrys sp.]|nr:hypothetical protein [Pseudolabrys sp.]MDP2296859.1 hypothetical protein [Pseudolabrys sp.]